MLDMWAHILSLKKDVDKANKIMKLSFFLITIRHKEVQRNATINKQNNIN